MRTISCNKIGVFISIALILLGCKSSKTISSTESNQYRFAFYNVENLFDTINHPEKLDDDFTPTGKNKWTSLRYQKKLNNLAKVFTEMEYPIVIGLCEVENKTVVEDLVQKTSLSSFDYGVEHHESPDIRGIDVALVYQKAFFRPLKTDIIRIDFPKDIVEDYTTRDILYVKGIFQNRDTIHFYVNHWPSRRGGLEKSEPKRMYVAEQLKKSIASIMAADKNAKIIVMGDFNDETNNKSIVKALEAKSFTLKSPDNLLHNCSSPLDLAGKGSYNYRGNWNMLDQFIVSSTLLDKKAKLHISETKIFQKNWMMYKDPRFGLKPNRTYGGPNYYGGYSDHLPVYVDVTMKQ